MTREEFAKKIRGKFPSKYDDLTDEELVSKTLEKYPQYKEDVEPSSFGTARKERSKVDQFITGAGKGVISTVEGLSSLSERLIRGTLKTMLPKSAEKALKLDGKMEKTAAEELIPKTLRTPETKAEKAGFMTEQIAEFFVPATKVSKAKKGLSFGKKLLAKGKNVLKEAAEIGTKAAIQTGGDKEESLKGAAMGAIGGAAGEFVLAPVMKGLFPKLSKSLEKTSLRLTPTQKRTAEKGIQNTIDLIEEKKIIGTPDVRVEKVKDLYIKAEDDIQKFLTIEAKDRSVTRKKIIEEIEGLKKKYANERDVISIEKQLDGFKDLLENKFPEEISIESLNKLKRSTYKNAYNKAGDKVLDFVEHDVGDVLRKNIIEGAEDLTINGKTLNEFNSEYGKIIEARKLLELAASRKQIGLVGKFMALGMGSSLGTAASGPVGAAVGIGASTLLAEHLAGTLARSLTAETLRQLSRLPAKEVPVVINRILTPLITAELKNVDKK